MLRAACALAAVAVASATGPTSLRTTSPNTISSSTLPTSPTAFNDALFRVAEAAFKSASAADPRPSPYDVFGRFMIESKKEVEAVWNSFPLEWREATRVSRQAIKSERNDDGSLRFPDAFWEWVPSTVGLAVPGSAPTWPAPCFGLNRASSTVNATTVTLTITAGAQTNSTCSDLYLLGTVDSLQVVSVANVGDTVIYFPINLGRNGSAEWASLNGARVFLFPTTDILTILYDLLETVSLFIPELEMMSDPAAVGRERQFLQDYCNITVNPRPYAATHVNGVVEGIDPSYFNTGDVLAIERLDGLGTLEQWATGAHTTHIAIFMRDSFGALWVYESTDKTAYWANPAIQKTLWEDWVPLAAQCGYNIVHLPLSDTARANFNVENAFAWAESMLGYPYGYHTFVSTFMDDGDNNLPDPATAEAIEVLAGCLDQLSFLSPLLDQIFSAGMAMRLVGPGTNMSLVEAVNYARSTKNMSIGELISLPAQDEDVYWDGPSYVCDSYACGVFKAAGVFGNDTDAIQCVEFHNRNLYSINVFNMTKQRPVQCVEADPQLPYCQLMGNWTLDLPIANTIAPYPYMFQTCPSEPPTYWSPPGC